MNKKIISRNTWSEGQHLGRP